MRTSNRNWLPLLALVLAGESVFFLPFVLVRIFRPTVLNAFNISNLELGQAFSVYGIVAMISYFFGGPLADKYSVRKLISFGLWSTAAGGFLLAIYPSSSILMVLYAWWGMTTILLFWAPLIKATRLWSGDDFQGRGFGGLETGRGLTAALLGSLSVYLFASQGESSQTSYQTVLFTTSSIVTLAGLFTWISLPDYEPDDSESGQGVLHGVGLKNQRIWYMAGIILCAYVGYKITDDYSLYANEVLGWSETESAAVGSGALWLRPLFALIAGFLADRWSASRTVQMGFLCALAGGCMIAGGWFSSSWMLSLVLLGFTLVGVYGIRGIYFAIMQEAAIPAAATGTAVGIMSVVGYTPDVFMSPLMGYLLDENPGELGHQLVFVVLSGFAFLGLLVTYRFRNLPKDV